MNILPIIGLHWDWDPDQTLAGTGGFIFAAGGSARSTENFYLAKRVDSTNDIAKEIKVERGYREMCQFAVETFGRMTSPGQALMT